MTDSINWLMLGEFFVGMLALGLIGNISDSFNHLSLLFLCISNFSLITVLAHYRNILEEEDD